MSDETLRTQASALWEEEAAQWWTLLHGEEEPTLAERQEFLAWVSRSPERIEAYLVVARLNTVLRADTVRWPDTPAETLIRAAKAESEPVPLNSEAGIERLPLGSQVRSARAAAPLHGRRRFGVGWAAVFGVPAAALTAALVLWLWLPGGAQFYRTGVGEQRSILLADGSRVTLNSASTVEVELDRRRRMVHLLSGEALFRVSHDPARPFDVYADDAVVRAIGTEFNVDMTGSYAAVTVLQGRVAVMKATQASLPTSAPRVAPGGGVRQRLQHFPAPPGALILGVAQRIYITPTGLSAPGAVSDMAAITAWTNRELVFEHRPLGEVVREINREGTEHIRIDSAALSAREVTGVIELDNPGSLLDFLADVPGVEIHRTSDGTSVVTLRREPPAMPSRMSEAPR